MERAMHQAHGIGYEVYSRKFEERLKVEQRREKEYEKGRILVAEIDRKLHV
ncbi:hypothetical protein MJG50_09525 [Fredinandcohnia sp. SECRCQ15]|uniref:Uncharacterized protein n=2 Tax=Fredinandcohnia quinoae TaxID=2918902 RepID=A0AAW5DYX5_9BACI|nr:hypothetical protein [Fredinandcohnia sp. SECRCQ15]